MITLLLAEAAALADAQLKLPGALDGVTSHGVSSRRNNEVQDTAAKQIIRGISSDSRHVQQGELFVALRGPHFDGHDYVGRAGEKGASAAMVERWLDTDLAQLKVADCEQALGLLGAAWRTRFQGRLIALTGSNGKTTTKEMLTSILSCKGRVSATKGNLNNHIGLPLTLARLPLTDDYAVIEMGANHNGEIAYLTTLAKPDIALITNAGPAHLEGFGSLDGVARGKGEIFRGLTESGNGIAVINADDAYADYWRGLIGRHTCIDFGLDNNAQIKGEILQNGTAAASHRNERLSTATSSNSFRLGIANQSIDIHLPLRGLHNVYNALAAAAASWAAGATLQQIKQGLEQIAPVPGRLQRLAGMNGSTIINDTYNANPASLKAALDICRPGREDSDKDCWLILGDMAELGTDTRTLHAAAGEQARAAGIRKLFSLGNCSRATAEAFGAGGQHFDKLEDLITTLKAVLASASSASSVSRPTLLIKGSRSMQMERVVRALQAPPPPASVADVSEH